MAPLRYAAKFDPFLSLDCARVEGVEEIKFCHLATMVGHSAAHRTQGGANARNNERAINIRGIGMRFGKGGFDRCI